MSHHLMIGGALLLGTIGVLFGWCALVQRDGAIDRMSMWYLGFGLPGSEMSALLATLGALFAAGFWALGAADSAPGQLALGLHAAAIAAILWAMWRARGAGQAIENAWTAAWGANYLDGVAESRRALLQRRWRPSRWWLPFGFREPALEIARNIPYVANAHAQQHLDVMSARVRTPGLRPVLLNIHGGGWMIGKKGEQAMPLQTHLARHGWLVVDADYRLSPQARLPDHLVDVKRAIAWTRQHAAEYGGDPRFIVLTGGSAGGHLVALAALTAGQPQWQPGFEADDTSVQVCVPFYGKYDFLGQAKPDPGLAEFLARNIFPTPRAANEALWQAMHPATHIEALDAAHAPPFLILHGTHDVLIPLAEAHWFVAEMRRRYAGEMVYAELPFAHHGWDVPNSPRADLTVESMQRALELHYARWCRRAGVTPAPAAAAASVSAPEAVPRRAA